MSASTLRTVIDVLECYRGREKTMRTLQYGLLFITSVPGPDMHHTQIGKLMNRLRSLSTQLGLARVVLRLFDDIPMLGYTFSYGLGKDEPDKIMRCLGVINNLIDQAYFPVEHIAWARDVNVLEGKSSQVRNASLILWLLSLYISILRSLRYIRILQKEKHKLSEEKRLRLYSLQKLEVLTLFQQSADMMNAINWLPWRPWSRPFPPWTVGLFGLISSCIGFYKLLKVRDIEMLTAKEV
ncbi:peroxisomal membrane protein 11C-like isoform X2 [Oratosquilla oratoria]|uniref:peroxisomal membrane protein 11C-like isoform X2 n=1 Tax=Oratosquilla oratoria TaxID=337810 RepID=UPI003F761858